MMDTWERSVCALLILNAIGAVVAVVLGGNVVTVCNVAWCIHCVIYIVHTIRQIREDRREQREFNERAQEIVNRELR